MIELDSKHFITQDRYYALRRDRLKGPNGWLLFFATQSGSERASQVVEIYNKLLTDTSETDRKVGLVTQRENGSPIIRTHADGETNPRLSTHVGGSNVFLFSDPHNHNIPWSVNDDIIRTLQLIYTLKVHGAERVNLVIPYMPYSRAERTSYLKREAAQSELFAKMLLASGLDTVISYHLHSDAIKAFFQPSRVVALSGMDFFIELYSRFSGDVESVVVSTDAGGAKQTYILSQQLNLDYAVSSKYRSTGKEVTENLGIIGNLDGKKTALISDDETVSFGSFLNAIRNLHENYGVESTYAAVSHYKITDDKFENLLKARKYGLKKLYITDTIPQKDELLEHEFIERRSLSKLFAMVINRMHYDQSVSTLFKIDNK